MKARLSGNALFQFCRNPDKSIVKVGKTGIYSAYDSYDPPSLFVRLKFYVLFFVCYLSSCFLWYVIHLFFLLGTVMKHPTVNRYKFKWRFVYDALKSFRMCQNKFIVVKMLDHRWFISQEEYVKVFVLSLS